MYTWSLDAVKSPDAGGRGRQDQLRGTGRLSQGLELRVDDKLCNPGHINIYEVALMGDSDTDLMWVWEKRQRTDESSVWGINSKQ